MRKLNSLADADGYYITVTKEHPRSEEHLPLAVLLEDRPSTPVQEEPATPAADPWPVIETLRNQIRALEAAVAGLQVPEPAAAAHRQDDDIPAFLRASRAPVAAARDPSVDDAIAAMNDIERRVMGVIEALARRVDEVATSLDMEPHSIGETRHTAEIDTLGRFLRSIDSKAAKAAAAATVEQPTAQAEPSPPEPDRTPAERLAIAGARRRNTVIGTSADERDLHHRLAEIALNGAMGKRASIDMLERLAEPLGLPWDMLARVYVETHDHATDVVVKTLAIESEAGKRLLGAGRDEAERIVTEAIEAIERVGQ